jgi:hypothetical protein
MAEIRGAWRAESVARTELSRSGDTPILWLHLPDGVAYIVPGAELAEAACRQLVAAGEQGLAALGVRATDQDALAVHLFAEQERLDPELLPTLHRLVAYVDSVRANPLNELVLAELAEVDR